MALFGWDSCNEINHLNCMNGMLHWLSRCHPHLLDGLNGWVHCLGALLLFHEPERTCDKTEVKNKISTLFNNVTWKIWTDTTFSTLVKTIVIATKVINPNIRDSHFEFGKCYSKEELPLTARYLNPLEPIPNSKSRGFLNPSLYQKVIVF